MSDSIRTTQYPKRLRSGRYQKRRGAEGLKKLDDRISWVGWWWWPKDCDCNRNPASRMSSFKPEFKQQKNSIKYNLSLCKRSSFRKINAEVQNSCASVAVECKDTNSRPSFRQEVKTDNHGEFKVHLPFPVSKHVKKIKGCSVKLISSNKPYCSIAATATSSNLHLKSRKEGTHIFSAGFFTFKPLKQPAVCDQKPNINNFKKLNSENVSPISNPNDPAFLPPIRDPPSQPPTLGRRPSPPAAAGASRLPPLPLLPLPQIPFLPPIPKKETNAKPSELSDNNAVNQPDTFPFPPNPLNPPSLFPPNPFQPPPSLFPPNPFQPPPSVIPPVFPSPPPSIFPPLFPSPPTPPVLPTAAATWFGTITAAATTTGISDSSSAVSVPADTGIPGVPPAEVSSASKTSSP
ncbi:hypothetical protein DH2020_012286 [Rehmannia glutinosa]|uniref:Uncharacterized protein n=1 Tax=Rehmannia glutinosa TaxID=99300 RepID=A0ABR0WYW9_REHGL